MSRYVGTFHIMPPCRAGPAAEILTAQDTLTWALGTGHPRASRGREARASSCPQGLCFGVSSVPSRKLGREAGKEGYTNDTPRPGSNPAALAHLRGPWLNTCPTGATATPSLCKAVPSPSSVSAFPNLIIPGVKPGSFQGCLPCSQGSPAPVNWYSLSLASPHGDQEPQSQKDPTVAEFKLPSRCTLFARLQNTTRGPWRARPRPVTSG